MVSDHAHAALMNAYIQAMEEAGYSLSATECVWQHFGFRGIIDTIHIKGSRVIVTELKTQLIDIGQAIRQVRLAKEYLHLARPDVVEGLVPAHRLVIEATEENYALYALHHSLFQDVDVRFFSPQTGFANALAYRQEIDAAVRAVQQGAAFCWEN